MTNSLPKKKRRKNQLKEDLDKGLEKTRKGFFGKIATSFAGKSTIDEDVLDDLEDILISSDVGVDTTIKNNRNESKRVPRAINILLPKNSMKSYETKLYNF